MRLAIISIFIGVMVTLSCINVMLSEAGADDWVLNGEIIIQGSADSRGTATVIRVDDEFKLWQESYYDSTDWRISYANSSDGVTWNYVGDVYNITDDIDMTDCNIGTADPCVRYIDGIYKMWYTWKAQDYTEGGHDYWSLGYAESNDGLTWTNETDKLGWTPNHNSTQDVHEAEIYIFVESNTSLHMYFNGEVWGNGVYYSYSSDSGLNWTQKSLISGTSGDRTACVHLLSNGSYVMYTWDLAGSYRDIDMRYGTGYTTFGSTHQILTHPGSGWAQDAIWDPRVFPITVANNPTANLSLDLSVGHWFMTLTGNVGQSGCTSDMKCGIAFLNNTGTHSCDEDPGGSSYNPPVITSMGYSGVYGLDNQSVVVGTFYVNFTYDTNATPSYFWLNISENPGFGSTIKDVNITDLDGNPGYYNCSISSGVTASTSKRYVHVRSFYA